MIRPVPSARFDQGPVRIKVAVGKESGLFTISRGEFGRAQQLHTRAPARLGAVAATTYWLYRGTVYAEDERLTAEGLAARLEQDAREQQERQARSRADLLRNARPPGPPRS